MSNKKINVAIVGNYGNSEYIKWLQSIDNYEMVISEIKNREDLSRVTEYPDLLVFTGGSDVNPDYYSEKLGKYTHIDKERDSFEYAVYDKLNNRNVKKLGICRGSQFLTVLSGGKLIQHVNGHMGEHTIETQGSSRFKMTSDHHQMLYPFELNKEQFKLIAWSEYFKSSTYLNGNNEEIDLNKDFLEPEIVYYNNTNSLTIQGHPEYSHCNKETSNYCKRLVIKLLESKL